MVLLKGEVAGVGGGLLAEMEGRQWDGQAYAGKGAYGRGCLSGVSGRLDKGGRGTLLGTCEKAVLTGPQEGALSTALHVEAR